MRSSTLALIPILLASYVSAHGYLVEITVGNGPTNRAPPSNGARNGDSDTTAIRQVTNFEPIYGVQNPSNSCGTGSRNAPRVLDANPGDVMKMNWKGGDGFSNWPHNTGPMLTYMANCGDKPCSEFDSRNARWFKIHQVGRKENSGEWFQQDLMSGATAQVPLPRNIAPGNYLVRHEIIALHLATGPSTANSGAEFYPGCAQLRIGGSGTGRPAESELVSHPGAYPANHPGITVPNVFSSRSYDFPGPPVAGFVNGAAPPAGDNNTPAPAPNAPSSSRNPAATPTGGNNNNGTPSASGTAAPQPTANNPSQGSNKPGQVCKAKKAKRAVADDGQLVPRSHGRAMRRLFRSSSQ